MFKSIWNKFIAMVTRSKLAKKAIKKGEPTTKEQHKEIFYVAAIYTVVAIVVMLAAFILAWKAAVYIASMGFGPFLTIILAYLVGGMFGKLAFFGLLKMSTMVDEACIADMELMGAFYEREFSVETVAEVLRATRWDVDFNNKYMAGQTSSSSKYRYNDQFGGNYA